MAKRPKPKPPAKKKGKRGRPGDRLLITEDPQTALDRLLKKPRPN